jgi:hypothetical protein
MSLAYSKTATSRLLDDLRSDAGMDWVPQSAWLTQLRVVSSASELKYDLAIDATGAGRPSYTAAGLDEPLLPFPIDLPELIGALVILGAPLLLFAMHRVA